MSVIETGGVRLILTEEEIGTVCVFFGFGLSGVLGLDHLGFRWFDGRMVAVDVEALVPIYME